MWKLGLYCFTPHYKDIQKVKIGDRQALPLRGIENRLQTIFRSTKYTYIIGQAC